MNLKPCPFCGGEAKLNVYSNNGKPTDWSIRCKVGECSASIYGLEGEENITTRWNRRPGMPMDASGPCIHADVIDLSHAGREAIRFDEKLKKFFGKGKS